MSDSETAAPPKARLITGGAIFVTGFLSPLLIPLVASSSLPTGWKTTISGLLLVGIPELGMLLAAAVLGKAGFAYLKGRIFGLLKKIAPPDRVSPMRYRIGLFFFVIPLLAGWIIPYVSHEIAFYQGRYLMINIIGDAMLLMSLVILGGDFWDKLRALFVRDVKITIQ